MTRKKKSDYILCHEKKEEIRLYYAMTRKKKSDYILCHDKKEESQSKKMWWLIGDVVAHW